MNVKTYQIYTYEISIISCSSPPLTKEYLEKLKQEEGINDIVLCYNITDSKKSWLAEVSNRGWVLYQLDWAVVPETLQKTVRGGFLSTEIDTKAYAQLKSASLLLAARTPEGIITDVFGSLGDKAVPPFTFEDGFTPPYSTAGPPYPERTSFNYLYNQLYALGFDVNRMGGALQWDVSITYDQYAVVAGTDGQLYIAISSQAGNDPVGDGGVNWLQVPARAEIATLQSQVATLQMQVAALQNVAPIALARCDQTGALNGQAFNLTSSRIDQGRYQFTFITPQPDTNYKVIPACGRLGSTPSDFTESFYDMTTTYFRVATRDPTGGFEDARVAVAVYPSILPNP